MASSFKNAHTAVGTSATTVYTCGGSLNSSVIHGMFFANTHGSANVNVTLELVDSSSGSSRKMSNDGRPLCFRWKIRLKTQKRE